MSFCILWTVEINAFPTHILAHNIFIYWSFLFIFHMKTLAGMEAWLLSLCFNDLPAERHREYPGSEVTLPPHPAWPFWSRVLLGRTKDTGRWMNEWMDEWINSGISLKQMMTFAGGNQSVDAFIFAVHFIVFYLITDKCTETHRCLPHNPQWTSWSETWQSELRRKKKTMSQGVTRSHVMLLYSCTTVYGFKSALFHLKREIK